uniref:Putative endonuclease/reverse transcript n=2 Tax=Ixodes ricinus TaxID=34613 RepID=V5IC65_IXORI
MMPPQGSVLGPLLFLIYINDLPTRVSSSISLFADDCVIYKEILNDSDIAALQTNINNVTQWCNDWLMELNISKCKSMCVSRQINICPCYSINNSTLLPVSSYKYLGVHISNDLSWNIHVDYVTKNANQLLGYIKRNFFLAPLSLKLLIYKTLIRPKLEYAASIWNPGITLASAVESIQNRSARFILSNYHRTASTTLMKASLSLPTLSLRRKISRLCLFHKIYHSNPTLRQALFSEPFYVSSRTDHQLKVGIPHCSTSTFNASFLPQTSIDWNRLPAAIVTITASDKFKIAITNLLHDV